MMLSFARICFKDDKGWKEKMEKQINGRKQNDEPVAADDDVVNSIPGLIVEAKRV